MDEQTIKQRILNWLKELWGEDNIMMERIPSEELKFGLGEKRGE